MERRCEQIKEDIGHFNDLRDEAVEKHKIDTQIIIAKEKYLDKLGFELRMLKYLKT